MQPPSRQQLMLINRGPSRSHFKPIHPSHFALGVREISSHQSIITRYHNAGSSAINHETVLKTEIRNILPRPSSKSSTVSHALRQGLKLVHWNYVRLDQQVDSSRASETTNPHNRSLHSPYSRICQFILFTLSADPFFKRLGLQSFTCFDHSTLFHTHDSRNQHEVPSAIPYTPLLASGTSRNPDRKDVSRFFATSSAFLKYAKLLVLPGVTAQVKQTLYTLPVTTVDPVKRVVLIYQTTCSLAGVNLHSGQIQEYRSREFETWSNS